MKTKQSAISISSLARYASDPKSIFDKVNAGSARYGNRAHDAIGKGPSLISFILIAIAIVVAAKLTGFF